MKYRLTTLTLVFVLLLAPFIATAQFSFSPEAEFIIGPQAPMGSTWFDQTQLTKGRAHSDAFPASPPPRPTSPQEPVRANFSTDAEYQTANQKYWSDPAIQAWLAALDVYVNQHYYDLGFTQYALYARTGDPADLANARKINDSWWLHPFWIQAGAQRNFDDGQGPPPRHAGIAGLILRALDGRPEMWDWITAYTRHQFNVWLQLRINNSELYYGVREGAFMLHYAAFIAATHPDPSVRAEFLAKAELVSVNYFGRLQYPDGSWRWSTASDEYVDSDGGTLQGVMQPFMVGLLLNALIDVHRLTNNPTIANQIVAGARHLYFGGPYRTSLVPGLNGERWRDFWYLYHGGTSVNPTRYENGGQSYTDLSFNDDCGTSASCTIGIGRQAISTIFSAVAYAAMLTGDPALKAAGEDLFDAAFVGSDGFRGLANTSAKNYNQNYRMGGRYLVWMGAEPSIPTPTPSPSATPTPTPSPSPSPLPSPSPTPVPSPSPTPEPSPTPSPTPAPSPRCTKVNPKGKCLKWTI